MTAARDYHTATPLPNGKVLVAGGMGTNLGALASAELFDPATGTWSATGPMINARFSHTATLLADGQVLVVGGGAVATNAELYDPASGAWKATGSLNTGRSYHTATLLRNGLVLVAGGYGNGGDLVSAELYNPASGTWTATGSLNNARDSHTATLLPNGNVLATGGYGGGNVLLASAEVYDVASGEWSVTGSLNTARYHHTATLLPNGVVLAAGGFGTKGAYLASAELYNPTSGTWTNTGSLNTARCCHTETLLPSGQVLAAGGGDQGSYLVSVELYDPAAATWRPTTALNIPREFFTATLLPNGQVLVAGGSDGGFLGSAEIYNPASGTFTNTGPLHTARYSHTATLLSNGKVLAAAGYNTVTNAELYNPTLGTNGAWVTTASLNQGRYAHTATLLGDGQVLVAGGYAWLVGTLRTAELFDPTLGTNGTWSTTGWMGGGRYSHTATLLNDGQVLVAGGFDDAITNCVANAELYDPSLGAWTTAGSLLTPRVLHTATLLPHGKVLVAGGESLLGVYYIGVYYYYEWLYLTNAEVYDPLNRTWTSTGSMNTARDGHTATLLPNGQVLVAGGYGDGGATNSAEVYDPVSGTWTVTGSLNTPRYSHTATLLPNGQVLVEGGIGTNYDTPLASAELYNPASGTWTVTGSLNTPRYSHTATLLPNGKLLVAGGYGTNGSLNSTELYDVGLGFNASWQPQIATFTSSLTNNGCLALTGAQFRGVSEGSCGGTPDSPADYPAVQLRRLDNEQSTFLLSTNWSAVSWTSVPVSNFPCGYALATMFVNGVPSTSSVLLIPALPRINMFGNGVAISNGSTNPSVANGTDFGSAPLGSGMLRTYTIQNTGTGPLDLTGVTFSGPAAADFGVTLVQASHVAADGGTTILQVSFLPSASGLRSAMVSITSNDSNQSPYVFGIQGTGTTTLAATYTNSTEVPLTVSQFFINPEDTVSFSLNFAPTPGADLMVVNNTGPYRFYGTFANLTNGQTVVLSYGGTNYTFVADYYGGNGNDLVLMWANNHPFGWGYDGDSELGDNNLAGTNQLLPVAVTATGVLAGKTIVSLAVGGRHSLALCMDGTLAAWGNNAYGQLGNNTTNDSLVPVLVNTSSSVSALFGKTPVAIAAGAAHSLALCSDGTVAAWGYNEDGELGGYTADNVLVPVPVPGASGATAIAAGWRHSLALVGGTVVACGYNGHGELGNGTTLSSYVPGQVNANWVGYPVQWVVAIAAGGTHSLALLSDGTVAAWGDNSYGQLGINSAETVQSLVPVTVATAGGGISALNGQTVIGIAAGGMHSVALCSNGTVATWGYNHDGELGNGTASPVYPFGEFAPVALDTNSGVSALSGKTVVGVAAGYEHGLALCADGTVAAWGYNGDGELGDNTTINSPVPVAVDAITLGAGQHLCGVFSGSSASHALALAGSQLAIQISLTGARKLAGGAFQCAFTSTSGALFSVLATTNLSVPMRNWTVLGSATQISPGQYQFTDWQATNSLERFYRLRITTEPTPFVLASDNAAQPAYVRGLTNGCNGGFGFGPWTISGTGAGGSTNGTFVGTSVSNVHGAPGIDSSGLAWGVYANSGANEDINRPFNAALAVGQTFSVDMDNGSNNGVVGVGLHNAGGGRLWGVLCNGINQDYLVSEGSANGAIQVDSGVAVTTDGLHVSLTLTGPTNWTATLTTYSGQTNTLSGILMSQADESIAQFSGFNLNAGSGSDYNLFFNNLLINQ